MSENKTQPNSTSVTQFIEAVENQQKRTDSHILIDLFEKITGEKATMWGPSIIGFGTYHYKYESGREGDFMQIGFSPRKAKFSLYIMAGFENYTEQLSRLGKFKTSKACLYVNKLSDINLEVLEEIAIDSVQKIKEKYP